MAQQAQLGKNKVTRLPLLGAYSNRGYLANKDQRFVNIFPETRKVEQIENTKIFLNKRPGLKLYKDFGTGAGRGMAQFNGKLYMAIGDTVWEDGVTPTAKVTLTGTTGQVGMLWANSSTLGDYLFICDGTKAWVLETSGTVTEVTDTSLHSGIVTTGGTGFTPGTYAATLTGGGGTGASVTYTVVGTAVVSIAIVNAGTGYTSAPAITFPLGGGTGAVGALTLNAFPTPHVPVPTFLDGYVVLARANSVDVYTCDLDNPKLWSAESFLSAEMFPDPVISLARQNNQVVIMGHNSIEFFYDAANASGSPLSRNDSTTIQMGTVAPYCIYQNEQFCAYVSHSDSGGRAVWLINGFQPKKVSDEYIERILDAEGDMTACRGFGFRTKGHMFYLINLKNSGRTLLYDIDEKLWHEWSSNTAGSHGVFACDYMADMATGAAYVLHNSNGCVYTLDPDTYEDDGTPILLELVTNRYDMDTYQRKFLTAVRLVGDRYEAGNSVDFSWTDDDYQNWSNTKTITLTDDYPAFQRLGAFRRRAFRIKHSLNYPLRLESLEVEYKEGSN